MEESKPHNPGGKVKIKVAPGVTSSAVFSDCGKYRYRLIRRWERLGPMVLFVLQNPSTADENHNDPTVAKCCRYAKSWGYSGVMIGNVCAYRSTDNKQIISEYFTNENLRHVSGMSDLADLVVLASGKPPNKLAESYDKFYIGLLQHLEKPDQFHKLSYLKKNKRGSFSHPLYLREDLKPTSFSPETFQVAPYEFWDSLSSRGFPVEPRPFLEAKAGMITWSEIQNPDKWELDPRLFEDSDQLDLT